MNRKTLVPLTAFGAGLLFGAGLVLGGMTDPNKVLGFLDFAGDFDPTLVFVMAGAIAVHAPIYRIVRRRSQPLLATQFQLPTRKDVDLKLVGGAALFGVGWGLAGYCPGPGITSLLGWSASAWVFVLTMALGSYLAAKFETYRARPALQAASRDANADLANTGLEGGA